MLNASLMRLLRISKLVICGSTQNFFDWLLLLLLDDDDSLCDEEFSLLSFTFIRTQSGGRSFENISKEVLF